MDTMTEAVIKNASEAEVYNARKRFDDFKMPSEKTRDLCEEIIWWHNAMNRTSVTFDDLMIKTRLTMVCNVRADCMRRLREVRGWSFPRIGKYFGGMDHTTCMHHCSRPVMRTKTRDYKGQSVETMISLAEKNKWRKIIAKTMAGKTERRASNEMV